MVSWFAGVLLAAASLAPRHAAPGAPASIANPTVGAAEIHVGAELMAIQEVTLDEAVIGRGSHVSVTAKSVQGGNVFLDVVLADGHVVKSVPIVAIQKSFRVVG